MGCMTWRWSPFPESTKPWGKVSLYIIFHHISGGKQVICHAFANKRYINWAVSWVQEWSCFMLLKGSRISEGFPSLLQCIVICSSMTPCMYFLAMGMKEDIPIYITSVRIVTDCIISFVWWWMEWIQRISLCLHLYFFSPLWVLSCLRSWKWVKTFHNDFLIQLFSSVNFVCFGGALECVKA
jgi:uncharacterized protein (DUF983 family)